MTPADVHQAHGATWVDHSKESAHVALYEALRSMHAGGTLTVSLSMRRIEVYMACGCHHVWKEGGVEGELDHVVGFLIMALQMLVGGGEVIFREIEEEEAV